MATQQMKKTRSKPTPSLAANQAWTPKSGVGPYRKRIKSGVPHPEERDVETAWETTWHDPAANAKAAQKKRK
jgi:hypothetical protein